MRGKRVSGSNEAELRAMIGCLFAGSIVVAPFVALLYSQMIGLVVLAFALGGTVAIAREAARTGPDESQQRLRLLVRVNLLFLAVTLVAIAWLLAR